MADKFPNAPAPEPAPPLARRPGLARAVPIETALQYGVHALLILVLGGVAWAASLRLSGRSPFALSPGPGDGLTSPTPTAPVKPTSLPAAALEQPLSQLPSFDLASLPNDGAITRDIVLHTDIPTRPRVEVITYTVQVNDTLFGIAERYALQAETLLWGNYNVLKDDPHSLSVGQVLNILPVNGTYHLWVEGQGLNGVAEFYGVTAQEITDWPGNHLDPALDPANPGIPAGTMLIIPGGRRVFNGWPEIPQITRKSTGSVPVDAGPGQCAGPFTGAVGSGSFIWPSASHRISGYAYSSYHPGIDIGESLNDPIYASDAGVVVYAGWNNWGYGNLVVIDHGNGWQTVYAHLNIWNVACGQSVAQGTIIAGAGTTGRSSGVHLHFEMRNATYGRVNPLNFLP